MLEYEVHVTDHEKLLALHEICEKEGVTLNQICFVGNDLNDRESMERAGYSIALNAKDEVKAIADVSIDTEDLRDILNYLYIS